MEKKNPALLLLPPPPTTLSPTNTKAAYGPAIDATLDQINRADRPRFDIAISVPPSWIGDHGLSRTVVFEAAQKTLAHTYSSICAAAANRQIELDCLGGVDARAFFLLPERKPARAPAEEDNSQRPFSGPLIDFATFIGSEHTYETLFAVESEEGETLLRAFIDQCESKHRYIPTCRRVPGGLSITRSLEASLNTPTSYKAHTSVAVGGTFDHLHIGHKLLLSATALLAAPKGSQENPSQTVLLTIGISGEDLLTKKKFAEELESWDERQQKVAEFLESVVVFSAPGDSNRKVDCIFKPGPNGKCVRVTFDSNIRIDYVEILDPFGPTITDENISALVLSQETRSGGKAINEKRVEKGWTPLEIFEIDVLEVNAGDEDGLETTPASAAFESKISSTDMRRRIHEKRSAEG